MRRHRRSLAGLGAFALLAGPAALPALAENATIEHRQSVLTELDADGTIRTARYFTQLNVTGGEALSVSDQPTAGLRNLESFGGVDRDGNALSYPAGFSRTVADFDGDQPVSIEVSYRLDGEPIAPRDLVGRSGEVEVTYRVSNDTAVSQEIEFKDATGVWRTETIDVAVPMVGSLSLDLGEHFTDISAPGAVTVGDGRGDTRLQWSLLLFAPLGSEVVEASWTAQVEDATVPAVRIQVLPVDKTSFGSLASTEAAYRSASDDTYALTQGAIKIDRSLSRLASGAASLLDGLGQLKDGAEQLASGLTTAVDGSGELSDGLVRLATGAGDLRDGVSQARNGSDDLAEGLGQLDAGAGSSAPACPARAPVAPSSRPGSPRSTQAPPRCSPGSRS
jgi:putative membrane protein